MFKKIEVYKYFRRNFSYNKKMDSTSYFKIEKIKHDIILTPNEGYDKVIIFLHGLGDSANGFKDFFDSNYKPIPNKMKVVLLTAPQSPVTINGGVVMHSWYDIKSLSKTSKDSIEESDVRKNSERIVKVIENEAKLLNNDYSRIVLGGFSQGAAMSLHSGLTLFKNIGGIIALSGYFFPFTAKEIENDESKKQMPIFLAHGCYDEVIPEPLAKTSYEVFKLRNFSKVVYKSYNDTHTIAAESLHDIKNFINKLF